MLIGNVGQDPEVRYLDSNTAGGNKVAQFNLATTERYRDRAGELREITEWHTIVAWRGLADVIEKFVKKGTQLFVEGRIRTRSWEDQNGNKRYVTEILADNIQLLGRRQDNPAGQGGYQNRQGQQQNWGGRQQQGQQGRGGFGQQQGSYQQGQNSYQQQGQGSYQQGQGSYQQGVQQPQAMPQVPPTQDEDDDLPF